MMEITDSGTQVFALPTGKHYLKCYQSALTDVTITAISRPTTYD